MSCIGISAFSCLPYLAFFFTPATALLGSTLKETKKTFTQQNLYDCAYLEGLNLFKKKIIFRVNELLAVNLEMFKCYE